MSTVERKGLGERIGRIIHEGNVRHVIVEKEGRRRADLPLTIAVISVLVAPWLVAILAAIAVIAGYSIRMERTEPESTGNGTGGPLETPSAPSDQSGPAGGGPVA